MKMRSILIPILICIGISYKASSNENSFDDHQHSQHGFILLGKEQKYLYHLARYNSPHQYMAIFKVNLFDKNNLPFEPQAENGKLLSALSVDKFVLPQLLQLSDGRVKQFSVDIFNGYLRSDDKIKIHENIKVDVVGVTFFKEIFLDSYRPQDLTYVVFGKPKDYYLAHSIGGAPNYEQVLEIDIEKDVNLPEGKEVVISRNIDNSPLPESSHATGEVDIYYAFKFNFFVKKEYIMEKGILHLSITL